MAGNPSGTYINKKKKLEENRKENVKLVRIKIISSEFHED